MLHFLLGHLKPRNFSTRSINSKYIEETILACLSADEADFAELAPVSTKTFYSVVKVRIVQPIGGEKNRDI